MEDTLGTFDRGKKFDAVMVDFDLAEEEGAFEFDVGVGDWAVGNAGGKKSEYSRDRMEEEEALLREKVQEGFEKFVVCGDDRWVACFIINLYSLHALRSVVQGLR